MTTINKINEINIVSEIIDSCTTIDQMGIASILIDSLERSQPKETEILQSMRNLVCDLTFKFYFERYGNSNN